MLRHFGPSMVSRSRAPERAIQASRASATIWLRKGTLQPPVGPATPRAATATALGDHDARDDEQDQQDASHDQRRRDRKPQDPPLGFHDQITCRRRCGIAVAASRPHFLRIRLRTVLHGLTIALGRGWNHLRGQRLCEQDDDEGEHDGAHVVECSKCGARHIRPGGRKSAGSLAPDGIPSGRTFGGRGRPRVAVDQRAQAGRGFSSMT